MPVNHEIHDLTLNSVELLRSIALRLAHARAKRNRIAGEKYAAVDDPAEGCGP
jgi:hypothetical protein